MWLKPRTESIEHYLKKASFSSSHSSVNSSVLRSSKSWNKTHTYNIKGLWVNLLIIQCMLPMLWIISAMEFNS